MRPTAEKPMRFAIYFFPPFDHPLTVAGQAWLGRDAVSGARLAQPWVRDLGADRFAALTAAPRRYGFHATLKAPFAPRDGVDAKTLIAALDAFAAAQAPFTIEGLSLTWHQGFLALTPSAPSPALNDLAAASVRHFESYRALLSDAALAKRRQSALTARQDTYLRRFGYPYVFEEFAFHMTLSERLGDRREMAALEVAARRHFADVVDRPLTVDTLALFVEPEPNAPFRVFHMSWLGVVGASRRSSSIFKAATIESGTVP